MCSTGVNVILLTPVRSLWPSLRRLSEIRNDQQRYVHISSTEFHSNKKKKWKMLIQIRSRFLMKYGFNFADFHETDRHFANFYEDVLSNFNIIHFSFVKQLHISVQRNALDTNLYTFCYILFFPKCLGPSEPSSERTKYKRKHTSVYPH